MVTDSILIIKPIDSDRQIRPVIFNTQLCKDGGPAVISLTFSFCLDSLRCSLLAFSQGGGGQGGGVPPEAVCSSLQRILPSKNLVQNNRKISITIEFA